MSAGTAGDSLLDKVELLGRASHSGPGACEGAHGGQTGSDTHRRVHAFDSAPFGGQGLTWPRPAGRWP
jgi:hypothetical protein